MAYGDIHNKTGTICKAKSDATCPLSEDGGHSRDTDEYIDTISSRDGIDSNRVRALVKDGTPPADALALVRDDLDSQPTVSKRSVRSSPSPSFAERLKLAKEKAEVLDSVSSSQQAAQPNRPAVSPGAAKSSTKLDQYRIGRLYTGQIRDIHRRYGVPVRETKAVLDSVFYIDRSTLEGLQAARAIDALIARVRASN